MKKEGVVLVIFILLIGIVYFASFVSASWWDNFYNELTGKDTATIGGGSSGDSGGGGGGSYEGTPTENGTLEVECRDENYPCTVNNMPCCSGLIEIPLSHPSGNTCIAASCGSICAPCGNGICQGNENECNCPNDCCKENDVKKYLCPDGSEVQWCVCNPGNIWMCIGSPENECPTPPTPPDENATPTCPGGCICNGGTIACSSPGEIGAIVGNITQTATCPVGCVCTNETIVCEANRTNGTNGCVMGCKLNEACVLPGIRTSVEGKRYCDVDSQWKEQKQGDEICDNNFECQTNLCIDGKCVSSSLWQKILDWFRNLFG